MEGYFEEVEKKRRGEQVRELDQVIAKFRALRTEGAGGGAQNEVEKLRKELDVANRQIKEWETLSKQLGEALDKERDKVDELKSEIELLEPEPTSIVGPVKKIKTGEDVTDNENLKECREQLRSCLESDIPANMSLTRLRIINEYIDDNIHDEIKPDMSNLTKKYKKIEDKLWLLRKYFPNEYEEEEEVTKISKSNALTFLFDDIKQEIKEASQVKDKANILKQVNTILEREIFRLNPPDTSTKKRQFEDTKCRVCRKVGGRLLCEETPPHRVFCGLVCQSKFYYK